MARGVGEIMARDGGWMVSVITSSAAHGEWLDANLRQRWAD